MRNIEVLDCTLRDGAQTNAGRFGEKAIQNIILGLRDAGIDMIECGFLKDTEFEEGRTYYPQPSYAKKYIPQEKGNATYVALVDYGRYNVDALEVCDHKTFDFLRISIFEKDVENVKEFAQKVKEKGYRFSIQPMDTYSYSEENIRKIIDVANEVKPETLAMVDTYSLAMPEDVERVYEIYEKYLDKEIKIGFHSHNNQLNSLALAEKFMTISSKERDVVIDSSLLGMGRGGGNLNTELFLEHLMKYHIKNFKIKPVLDLIDRYMLDFKERFEWGYSMPMLYAGLYGVHVNTTTYLMEKPNVTSYDLRCMFEMLDEHKKKRYDYDYLDMIYDEYMKKKEGFQNE